MSTGEGADVGGGGRDERADRDDRDRRGERIGVGAGDESVTRIQLAARWAESYGPAADSLGNILRRFRAAFEYLDAVTHGVEPPDIAREMAETRTAAQPLPAPAYAPAQSGPPHEAAPPPPPPPAPQPESRPWG
ncbi:MAG: hypothetical protein E6I75_19470 [Chloroflexi bacterium]|nr:MAG: hypothetical protein E6I75_19470 [Chloroflexota bacterium]